jgi:flagellar export protein FliJ
MPHVYPLEQVLRLRQQQENQRKEQLAMAEVLRRERAHGLDALLDTMEEQMAVACSPDMLEHRDRYMDYQSQRIEAARQTLQRATESCSLAQAELTAAALEKKKFERHRELSLQNLERQRLAAEQQVLDECATQMFVRTRGGNSENTWQ